MGAFTRKGGLPTTPNFLMRERVSDRCLRAHLHYRSCRTLKLVGRIIRKLGKRNESERDALSMRACRPHLCLRRELPTVFTAEIRDVHMPILRVIR